MLKTNDVFPSLSFAGAAGGEIRLPDDVAGGFGVILFYRGAWSDVCSEQHHAFSRTSDKIAAEGMKVVTMSVDARERAEALVERYELTFAVGYAADAREASAVTGMLVNEETARGDRLRYQSRRPDPHGRLFEYGRLRRTDRQRDLFRRDDRTADAR